MVSLSFEEAVDIKADPSLVWAFLTDASNVAKWRNGVTFEEPGKLTLGSKVHYMFKFRRSALEEVIRLVPNEVLITRAAVEDMTLVGTRKPPRFEWEIAWFLTALNGDTRVTCQSYGEVGGITGVISWLLRGLLAKGLRDETSALKVAIETT